MKTSTIAALSILVALPVHAGERHRQSDPLASICDNEVAARPLELRRPLL